MVWTAALDVDPGDYTKASDYDTLADNPEYLQVLADVDHDFHITTGTGKHKTIQFLADSTYNVGSAAVRAATVFTDTLGDSGQALAIAATTVTLPSGFVFSYNGGDVTVTHAANTLTWAGAATGYSWDTGYMAFGAALGSTYPFYFSNTKTDNFLMRIDNTVSGGSKGHGIQVNFTASAPDDNTYKFFQGADSSTERIYIYSDGDLQNHDNSYGGISDVSLKQDIVDARDYWEDWKQLRFRKYRFISDVEVDESAPHQLGVVAQEVEEVFPGVVQTDTLTGLKGVKYSVLDVIACKVLQEAIKRIEALEAAT